MVFFSHCVVYFCIIFISQSDVLFIFHLDVTRLLFELEVMIQRVKVTTTPDGRVMDLFFITDNL